MSLRRIGRRGIGRTPDIFRKFGSICDSAPVCIAASNSETIACRLVLRTIFFAASRSVATSSGRR